jgi:hypothetical protein
MLVVRDELGPLCGKRGALHRCAQASRATDNQGRGGQENSACQVTSLICSTWSEQTVARGAQGCKEQKLLKGREVGLPAIRTESCSQFFWLASMMVTS